MAPRHYRDMTKRKNQLEGQIGAFIRQYARKHYPNIDPNDRRYDREIEARVRRMSAEELDALMHGSEDGNELDVQTRWLAGERIPGVEFQLNDSVEVIRGEHAGAGGAVVTLLGDSPEPRYVVELGSTGEDVGVYESALRPAI